LPHGSLWQGAGSGIWWRLSACIALGCWESCCCDISVGCRTGVDGGVLLVDMGIDCNVVCDSCVGAGVVCGTGGTVIDG